MSPTSLCVRVLVCVPEVESHEKAFKHTQLSSLDVLLYHTVWTFHVHCRVRRRDQAPVCQTLCGRCISRENISAECCHNISFQTDLWLPLRWGMTLRGLLYFFFPAPVMSYLFRSPLSCFVWWRPLFTVRVAMRHGAFLCFFYSPRCSVFTPVGREIQPGSVAVDTTNRE